MSSSGSRRRRPSRRQASRGSRTVGGRDARRKPGRLRIGALSGAARAHPVRLRLGVLFALSLAAGIALASPIEKHIAGWTNYDLGLLEQMAIQGNSRLSFAEIAATTGIRRGTPLASIDLVAVKNSLVAEPWIREADVLKLPPSTLLIRVEERVPRALLVPRGPSAHAAGPRLIDASGHLFAATLEDQSLPRLIGGDALVSDEQYPVLLTGLALFEQLQSPEFADLWGSEDDLQVYLPVPSASEGWVVRGSMHVVLGQRDLMPRIRRLSEVIRSDEAMQALGDERLVIDLRFADQAVLRRAKNTDKRRGGRS